VAPRLDLGPRLLAAGPSGHRQIGYALLIPALAFGRLGLQLRLGLSSSWLA
jgi:hypothetical protein